MGFKKIKKKIEKLKKLKKLRKGHEISPKEVREAFDLDNPDNTIIHIYASKKKINKIQGGI